MSERLEYLDISKGGAILLVVIGHIIEYSTPLGIQSKLYSIIYSFHMPFFFFISGCTAFLSLSRKERYFSFYQMFCELWNRFKVIIIPGIFWTIFCNKIFFNPIDFENLLEPLNEYWFLNALFIAYCLLYLIEMGELSLKAKLIIWSVIFMGFILFITFSFARYISFYIICYYLGYLFQRYNVLSKIPPYVYGILLFLFLILVGSFSWCNSQGVPDPNRIWMQVLITLSIVPSLLYLSKQFSSTSKVGQFLSWIGRYSLGIYLAHFLFIHSYNLFNWEQNVSSTLFFFALLICAIFISFMCIIIQKIFEKIPILSGLMYGKWKQE